MSMISALDALERLRDGNRRFAADIPSHDTLTGHVRRSELVAGQEPFAIILGCSDSRVPAEIVFDQGLGRSVCDPRSRKHCCAFANWQCRICGGANRCTTRRSPGPYDVRSRSGYFGRTRTPAGKSIAESSCNRRPRSPARGRVAGDGARVRLRCSGGEGRSGKHPCLRKSLAAGIVDS